MSNLGHPSIPESNSGAPKMVTALLGSSSSTEENAEEDLWCSSVPHALDSVDHDVRYVLK